MIHNPPTCLLIHLLTKLHNADIMIITIFSIKQVVLKRDMINCDFMKVFNLNRQ